MGKKNPPTDLTPELKICIIGAGFSGLCAAVQLRRKLYSSSFTVYESNSEVGGNWLVNTYPGCACDIQSHLYSYSFAPKADWTKEFSSQPEILEYMKGVARDFDIYKHIKFRHQVQLLKWNEKNCEWSATVYNMDTKETSVHRYDVVINGSGELRIPQIPEEFKSFKGPIVHSARWDPSIIINSKKVAVIGSGATAIQLIPSIADRVSELLCYQRQPAWVIPSFQSTFTGATKWAFKHVPGLRAAYRSQLFLSNELLFPVFETGTVMSKIAHRVAVKLGQRHINNLIKKDDQLKKDLLPNYKFGCKRVAISNKYYRALNKPHVKLITSKIKEVEADGIRTEDNNKEEFDVLILATGFRVHDYFAPMEIIGKDNVNILGHWKENGPKLYLGIASNLMPNNFLLLGPGSDVNHNSGVFQIECQVNWIIKVLKEMTSRKARRVAIKEDVLEEQMNRRSKEMLKTVYGNMNVAHGSQMHVASSRHSILKTQSHTGERRGR